MGNYREQWFKAHPSISGKYRCQNCGKLFAKKDIDIDHIIPQNRGGTDELWNLQALCKHCNRSKQDNMSSTPTDLAVNVIKHVASGRKIENVGGTLVNMGVKNTKNFIKKQLKK